MKQLLILLYTLVMATPVFSQPTPDTNLYPFDHHYFEVEAGRMHYVDEGDGPVMLFVHGTPTWSFLYREHIRELSKNYRCIAIDHLGFGLSDKPTEFQGTPQNHARNLAAFIQHLNLTDITLVVHDFGGPIGLGAALQDPDRIQRVVLFNSWLWATENDQDAQKIDKLINSGMGKFLYFNLNFSPKVLLKKGFADKKNLPKSIHKQYLLPFPNKASRNGLYQIAQALVSSSDWYEQQWQQLDKLEKKDWLILWGTEDTFISEEYLGKWTERLPEAHVVKWDCGHFVQEERTNESIEAIRGFVQR